MIKKIRIAAVIIFLATGFSLWYVTANRGLDADMILQNSKLKGRTFQGKVQEISALDGKVNAYLMEEHSVPLVAVSFGFARGGRAYEDKEGVGLLAESVMLDGAGAFERKELRNLMKEKGIKLGVSVSLDRLDFSLSYVKKFEKEALAVLKAVLYQPHLKEEDIDLARRQLAMLKRRQAEQPQAQLEQLVNNQFYGSHAYGREDIPSEDVLNSVLAVDIRAYLNSRLAKDVLTVGIAGDVDTAEAAFFLEQAFGGLADKSAAPQMAPLTPDFTLEAVEKAAESSAQSLVLLLAAGVKRLDEDFYPLYLADYIFGGAGLSSRLNQIIREKAGLTYGIYSYFSNSDAIDLWQIYFSATPENVAKIMEIAAAEYRDFYQNGVTAEELALAKKSLTASFNLRFSSLFNIAEMLNQMQAQGLGVDFLEKRQGLVAEVSLDTVKQAIKRRMPPALSSIEGVRMFQLRGKNR